ncbi:MAG: hypothetical protein COB67_04005 [SAR324 cluster bacterium]|uniref:SCO family protein n=1 Tax=SAR324 cluster bacterium TaxID=2024889 RepID=A0A2A4T8B1_9DELT|nr:MAG: hypothetical protein COB67_04005 [SAR324 cluster bacterium]
MWKTSPADIDFPPELARVMGKSVTIPKKQFINIYEQPHMWTDQSGKEIDISVFKGKTVVSSFIYTRCFKECLLTIIDVKRLDKLLTEEEKKDVRYVMFSFDPENDTPKALKAYAEQFDVDLSRWAFLTTDEDELEQMAKGFRFFYKKAGDAFSHTVQLSIVDRGGKIQKQFYGNDLDTDLVATHVRANL